MKILHTADLHLGRQFNGLSLEEDHAHILDQIVRALIDRRAEALVIAGDIYDRASPPASAVRQFNAFLSRVARETPAAIVMIAGNHDCGDRIGSMSIVTDVRRALIRGEVRAEEPPLVLHDDHGPVAFSALPFAYEYAARACFGDETLQCPEQVLGAQIAAARSQLPPGARWVVVAHAFVAGANPSEGERSLVRVGGVETAGAHLFAGAHYVALGHLHRPQWVSAPHIRYSGSPLAFGFDEAGSEKSMCLVDLDAAGVATIETIPFAPLREVRVLQGAHSELLAREPSTDIVRAILTDASPVIDAMKRLRVVFPNACQLVYARNERAPEIKSMSPAPGGADPQALVEQFLNLVREEGLRDDEKSVLANALRALTQEDAA